MGNFSEHIQQGKNNLEFLGKINESCNSNWDWQVTGCFYAALHLMSAHVVSKTNKNYLSHTALQDALNPYHQLSVSKIDLDTYRSYEKLYQLSRRSRYLIKESVDKSLDVQPCTLTYSTHFRKAIYHLDKVLDFIKSTYGESFSQIKLTCVDLNSQTYSHFTTT